MTRTEFGFSRWWIAVAAIAIVVAPSARAAEPVAAAKPELLSLAVAVKHVCAWPNLTPLADGAVVATIFNQPCHGLWEGDVECWATTDGGQSWQLRGTPAVHEPTTNRLNVAAGRNSKGELVVLASGWSHQPPRPPEGTQAIEDPLSAIVPMWVCRSADGGRTWKRAEGVEPPSKSRLAAAGTKNLSDQIMPFGDIIGIGEGKLGACLYAWDTTTKTNASYFFTSADDGTTWSIAGVIGPHGLNETTPLRQANGDLLACARTYRVELPSQEQRLEIFRSTDNGATWRQEQPVTTPFEHPAHLLQLADGRILVTYGDRNGDWKSPTAANDRWRRTPGTAPFPRGVEVRLPCGIEVRLSDDGGRTWSPPERLAGFDGDGGYPSTVELADGRLLTAFYAYRSALRDGYHMATVTWRPPPK